MARVGIIGTGWGARVQVPAFREAGLEVAAIAGHNAERTRNIAGQLDVEPFDDWRELIASNVDLVTIVTPPSQHLQMATTINDQVVFRIVLHNVFHLAQRGRDRR